MTSSSQGRSLVELKKLAKPALADVRLVNLARDGSVAIKKVVSVAEGLGVSRRQARGARWLAILRRNFGLDALEFFVSSMARARAEESVTEHAHLERTMSNERVLKSLELIKDPNRKFELMLNKGMQSEAWDYLEQLIETKTAFFWYNDGGGLGRVLLESDKPSGRTDKVVLMCHDAPEFHINRSPEFAVSLKGLCTEFGNDAVKPLVAKVIERVMSADPRKGKGIVSYWNVLGTTEVARYFLPGDSDLLRQAELWQTRFHFDEGRFEDLYRIVMPHDLQDESFRSARGTDWLNWLVDRFYQLAWTEQMIQQEFVDWLNNHNAFGGWEYYAAVAGAKCFSQARGHHKAVATGLHRQLPWCWEYISKGYSNRVSLKGFKELGCLGMYSAADNGFFKSELIKLLIEGKAALAVGLLQELGKHMGFGTWDDWDSESKAHKFIKTVLDSLAPEAFDKAFEAGHFGIAAALGQHFNCVDEPALHLKANRTFRKELEAVIDLKKVVDLPKDQENFWDELLDGQIDKPSEGQPATWSIPSTKTRECSDWFFALTPEEKSVLPQIQAERDGLLKELIRLRKVQINEAAETAMVVEQPIAFDLITMLK